MGADIIEHGSGKFSRAVYIKGGSANPFVFKGNVTTATSSTVFASTGLIGYGNDAFNGWEVYVFYDGAGTGAAPQSEHKPISGYVSSTGTFTHTAFTADLEVDDVVLILHPYEATVCDATEAKQDTIINDIGVVDGLIDVPAKDSTDDAQMRDVVGKKDDTAVAAVGTTKSLVAYTKGVMNDLSNATDGLGALKTLIDTVDAMVSPAEIIENIFDIDMGYWTEVDVPGRVTIDYTNERIAITDLDGDEDVYVYKATDADVEDFILDFEFQILSTTTSSPSFFGIGLADGIGTMEDVGNGLYARIAYAGVNAGVITIAHTTGGVPTAGDNISGLLDDTTYYARLLRRGSYCWLGVYSDRIRETHVTGSPMEHKDVTPTAFTHLYPMTGYDDGAVGDDMDAYVQAIKLISAPDIDKYLGRHIT